LASGWSAPTQQTKQIDKFKQSKLMKANITKSKKTKDINLTLPNKKKNKNKKTKQKTILTKLAAHSNFMRTNASAWKRV